MSKKIRNHIEVIQPGHCCTEISYLVIWQFEETCLFKFAVAKIQLKKSYFRVHILSFSEVKMLEQLGCKNILFRDYEISVSCSYHRQGFSYIKLG